MCVVFLQRTYRLLPHPTIRPHGVRCFMSLKAAVDVLLMFVLPFPLYVVVENPCACRCRPGVLVRSRGGVDDGEGVCDVVRTFDGGVRGHATKRRSNRGLNRRGATFAALDSSYTCLFLGAAFRIPVGVTFAF